jgi:hypothetical protein
MRALIDDCIAVTVTKSLDRIEIPPAIYDGRVGLELFSQDPTGFEGSDWNLYEYTGSNPVVRVDPTGQEWIDVGDPWEEELVRTATERCNCGSN